MHQIIHKRCAKPVSTFFVETQYCDKEKSISCKIAADLEMIYEGKRKLGTLEPCYRLKVMYKQF